MVHASRSRSRLVRGFAGGSAIALMVVATAACGSSDGKDASKTTTLTVYAAASLTSTFTELGKKFEATHKGVKVTFNFGGSSDLVSQLQQGAPADVFASADPPNMAKAVDAKLVDGSPVNFASNTLEIAVPPDNPAKVSIFADLAKPGIALVVCAPEVPCGAAAKAVESSAGVTLKPVSEEQSVTDVLNKVVTGEAQAGLVYVTDVKVAGDSVKGITFPESKAAVNVYPIAALVGAKHLPLAKQFLKLVTGTEGQSVLSDAGFAKP